MKVGLGRMTPQEFVQDQSREDLESTLVGILVALDGQEWNGDTFEEINRIFSLDEIEFDPPEGH